MELVFPTSFGDEEFYTVIDLKDVHIDSVKVVSKTINFFNTNNSDRFVINNPQSDKSFSVDQLNIAFLDEKTQINNTIDQFLSNRLTYK